MLGKASASSKDESADARTRPPAKDLPFLTPCIVSIKKKAKPRSSKAPIKKAIKQDSLLDLQLRRDMNFCIQSLSSETLKSAEPESSDRLRDEVDKLTSDQPGYFGLAHELVDAIIDSGVIG